jgi:hypothetical protein
MAYPTADREQHLIDIEVLWSRIWLRLKQSEAAIARSNDSMDEHSYRVTQSKKRSGAVPVR